MKSVALRSAVFAAGLLLPLAISSQTAPQADPSLDDGLNACVSSGYAASSTGLEHMTLTSKCKERIHVYFFASGPASGGTYMAPGAVENTHITREQIEKAGAFAIYACPADSIPVDATGAFAGGKREGHFRCKKD